MVATRAAGEYPRRSTSAQAVERGSCGRGRPALVGSLNSVAHTIQLLTSVAVRGP